MRKFNFKKQSGSYDKVLLILAILLTILGVIFVLNASAPEAINSYSDRYYFAKQQLLWGIIAVTSMFVVSRIHYNFWSKFATFALVVNLIFLVIVLIPNIGITVSGAKRWIDFGSFRFQPSELMKFTLTIYIAKIASMKKSLKAYLVPLGIVIALVMLQPDLGTSVIITLIVFSQINISGINFLKIAGLMLSGGVLGILLIITSVYRRERLLSYFQPFADATGRSYHIRQILYALGSGGLFGVGLGQSRQKYLFLPEASTDSIFAVIAEELGFLGASAFIFLFVLLVVRCLKIVKNTDEIFPKVLATGLTTWIAAQSLINLSSMVALTPLTGVPLPFISYGGSSLVTVSIACGILLNISKNGKK